MTDKDFTTLLYEQECQLAEHYMFAKKLVIDPVLLKIVSGSSEADFVTTPLFKIKVPVELGKSGEFLLLGSKEDPA